MLDRCNQGSKNDQHWHLTAKELLWVPWTYNFVSNTSCCMQWPWTRTMSQERFITPLLVLCVQLFTLDHRKTTKSVIINTAEDISPWHKYLCFVGNMSFLCSSHTTDINFLNIPTSCNWQLIFFTSRQRLNASYWCLQWTLPFAGPQSNLHIPRADPGSKKHISHFTLCCSGGERQRSFFPFLLDLCIHSRIGIRDSKSKDAQKKVAAHRHFLLHWLSFLCQGEGNTGRIASIGSIYCAESGKDWVDLLSRIPDLRVVNIFLFLSKTCSTRKPPKEEEEEEEEEAEIE